MKAKRTKHQEQMLYGSFKPCKESTPKEAKGVDPVKVKTRRSVEEIRNQKELEKQFDYL